MGRVAVEEIRLPESVREVIGRRLARLGNPCTKLLTLAAVIGHEFGLDVLERAGELQREPLIEALEEAVSARVVDQVAQTPSALRPFGVAQGSGQAGLRAAIGRYRFSHTLIRETLYQELRTLERVRLHGRVGAALERLFVHDPEPHLAEIAHHFLESLPSGEVTKAVEYAIRAGDRASERLAYEEAAILYGRALQALELLEPADARVRCELLLKLGEAQWNAGGFEKPANVFREAAELAEKLGAPELLARAALGIGGPGVGFSMIGFQDEVEADFLARALAALDETDTALRARVMGRMSAHATFGRGPDEALIMGRQAVAMARRVGDSQTLGYVLNSTPWATWTLDNLEERLALAEEALHLAEAVGDRRLAAEACLWRATHQLEIGNAEAADRDAEAQMRFAATSRQPYPRYLAAAVRAGRAFLDGRFEEVERYRSEASAAAIEAWGSHGAVLTWADGGLGPILREQQGTTGDEEIAAWESYLARNPLPLYRSRVARLCVQHGRIEEARRHFELLAANGFSDIPRNLFWLWMVGGLAQIAASLGDTRRAQVLYDLLLPYADRCAVVGTVSCAGSLSRHLGLLATTLSRFDAAEMHFEAALEMNARIRAVIWVAHTQHDYARMLCLRGAGGDRERAADFIERALATARRSGMRPLEQTIVATLTETGLGVPEKDPADLVSTAATECLFRREGDVWAIAYEGHALRLKDSKGVQYIAQLIRNEGQEIHTTDLAVGPVDASTETVRDRGHSGEVLDAQARAEYRERLRDLEADLEEATRWSDVGRAARIREEIEFLTDELSAAFGVGGRARKAGDVNERARKAVASRIRDSIERIRREHRALALHLENAVRTGAFCCYRPDRSPGWKVTSAVSETDESRQV